MKSKSSFRGALAGTLALSIPALAVVLALRTYYLSDDFVLLYEGVRTGSGWRTWIAPFFGHFGPGSFALTRIVGGTWGLDRAGAAVFAGLMILAALLLLYGIARAFTRGPHVSRARSLAVVSVSLLTVGLAIPILFYALGASMLPLLITTLAGVLAGLRAQATGRWLWWVVSAVLVLTGLAFWELAAFNIVFVPLTVWALERARPDVGVVGTRRPHSLSISLAYGIPILLGVILYWLNYRRFSFESGVRPANAVEILQGLGAWLGHGTVSLIGGGPFPRPGQGLGLGAPLSLSPGSLAPWLVGVGILVAALLMRRVRILALIVLGMAFLQGSVILYARYNFLGPDFVVLNPRYYSGLVAYIAILFMGMWTVVLSRATGTGRALRVGVVVVLVASFLLSVASWLQFAQQIGGNDRRDLISKMLDSAAIAPSDATMLSSGVSESLGWLAPPYNTSQVILWPELGDWRWAVGDGTRPMVIEQSGALSTAWAHEVSAWRTPGGTACATEVEMPFVKFDEPVSRLVTLRVTLDSAVSQRAAIGLNGVARDLELPEGTSRQVIQQYWYGTMEMTVSGEAADVCLEQVSIAESEATSAVAGSS